MRTWRNVLLAIVLFWNFVTPVMAGEDAVLPAPAAKALAKLRAATSVDDGAVGEAGEKSDTYRAYEVLRDTAPAHALVVLTGDQNPIVRCYAFRALAANHPDTDVFPILWRHLDDFAEVETFRGCIMGGEKVGDVMIDDARGRLDGKQARRILERLLRTKSPLFERARLLRSTMVPADLLPELRRLSDGGDEDALIALARHGPPEDVARIETRLRAPSQSVHPDLLPALFAASLHRDPRLLPVLEALVPRVLAGLRKKTPYRFRFYYAALAAQPSKRAADRLGSLLDAEGLSRHAHATLGKVVFEAVRSSSLRVHVSLLWRLWDEFGRLDEEVARRLSDLDAKRAQAGITRDLLGDPDRIAINAATVLLERLAESDQKAASSLVTQTLPRADVIHFPGFARLAGRWKAKDSIAPLFHAFQKKTNPYFYLAAAKALFAYDQPEIDARLATLAREIEHLKLGWGGRALSKVLTDKPRD